MSSNWQQFSQKYAMDEKYGVIIPPHYQISSFDFQTLLSANLIIKHISQVSALEDFISNFPTLQLQPPHSFNDLVIMHDFTNTIVNTLLAKKRELNMPQEGTRLSKNLAEPLYISSKALDIHYGMQINMFYNWIPLNDNYLRDDQSFSLKDVALRYYLTNEQYQEILFFGSAAIASFYLARIIQNCFEMNKIINERPNHSDEIVERLDNCLKYWQKIKQENLLVVRDFQSDYFNYTLRPLVRGFKDIILEGVENGQDLTVSAPGGSAGYDPTFQMFQAAFGIKSEGKYHEMQMMMRTGMPNKHLECILFFEQNSHIREYCSMSGSKTRALFNKVIMAYGSFLRVHSEFIAKFILGHSKQMQTEEKAHKGTAGTVIHQIILRYQNVEAQTIPEPAALKSLPKATYLKKHQLLVPQQF